MTTHLRKLSTLALALLATMICSVAASAQNGVLDAERSTQPAVRGPAEPTHQAAADLSRFEQPVLGLSNSNADRTLELHVVAFNSATGDARDVVLEIEAGGTADFSLVSEAGFDYLSIFADGEFKGSLTGGGITKHQELLRGAPIASDLASSKSSQHVCTGTWTLTCISPSSCTHQATAAGDVYFSQPFNYMVYWGAYHVPNGSWATTGQNGCHTTWREDFLNSGCPKTARNCHGETYLVTGAISLVD